MPATDGSGPGSPGWRDFAVVAITERRRMVGDDLLARGDGPAIASAFASAIQRAIADCPPGSVIVQVREKDLDGGPLLALVRAAQRHCERVVVNDRLDVAIAAGAFGVHLPERVVVQAAPRGARRRLRAIAPASRRDGGRGVGSRRRR